MVSDSTCADAAIWVLGGGVVIAAGNFVGGAVANVPIIGWPLFAVVWLVAHFYGLKLALRGVGVLVEDIVTTELDHREP